MTTKKLWTITIVFLAGHLILQYGFYLKTDLANSFGQITFVVDVLSNVILIFLLGAGLGAVIACIPFKQRTFKDKFKLTFPLLTSIILIILVITFSIAIYLKKVKGIELRPLHTYAEI